MAEQFKFDSDKNTGGLLIGDTTLRQVQDQLQQLLSSSVPGVANGTLSAIGVSMDGDGKLSLDASALEQNLASDPESVQSVLSLTASSSNVSVRYVTSNSNTVVDGTVMAVNITQAARRAQVTSGAALASTLGADETLTINGKGVNLTAGMTQSDVLAAINAQSSQTGVQAVLTAADGTGSGGYLTFRAADYGSAGTVSVQSDRSGATGDSTGVGNVTVTQASPGGESGAGVGLAGLDVAGTINGESATGKGQILTGDSGNKKTDGLRLRITSVTTGDLDTIQLNDGMAAR